MGSGAGLATKPSNCLMSAIVAAFTAGGGQLLWAAGRQQTKLLGPGNKPDSYGIKTWLIY